LERGNRIPISIVPTAFLGIVSEVGPALRLAVLAKLAGPSLLWDSQFTLAGNVGDMAAKCWQNVEMSMNLGSFACGCRHQNSPDTRFLCQKFPTLYPIPERTYAQRSNALPKILTLETDYVQSNATHLQLQSSRVITIIAIGAVPPTPQ
jgi:hypothetical protein